MVGCVQIPQFCTSSVLMIAYRWPPFAGPFPMSYLPGLFHVSRVAKSIRWPDPAGINSGELR
jgi:hypothetical protein